MNWVSNELVFDRRVTVRSIRFALHWQKSIGTRDDVVHAFEELRHLVHAQSILHVRQSRGSQEAVSAARNEPSEGKLFARPPRSYVSAILNEHVHSARPGKVWFVSDADVDQETLARLHRTDIAEVAVVTLENGPAHSDFLELDFQARLPLQDRMLLEVLGPLIAEAWQDRNPGSVAAMMAGRASRVARERAAAEDKPILHMDNPAGLTRSEFHVCVLIHEGLMPEDIARELNVKKSTLRSHMHAIYHKTGVSGQLELVHRLHGAVAAGAQRK